MAGHSPDATTAAVRRRIETLGGITTMLPTEDSGYVAAELTRRFGMPLLAPVASTALQLLAPVSGEASAAAADEALDTYLHLALCNGAF